MSRELSLRSVPEELRARYRREGLWTDDTLGALVDACVRAEPTLPVRIWSERRPFAAPLASVHQQACRLAAGLAARGVGPGDVVAFQLPNWAEAAATFFALSMLGTVMVPIVHSYGAREVGFVLRQSGARALVTADRFGRLDYVAMLEGLRPALPDVELVVMLAGQHGPLPAGVVSFEDVTAAASRFAGPMRVDPDAPAVIGAPQRRRWRFPSSPHG